MSDSLIPGDLLLDIAYVQGHVSAVACIADVLERLPLTRLLTKISAIDEQFAKGGYASAVWSEFDAKEYPEMIMILAQARAQLVALTVARMNRKETERRKANKVAGDPSR